MSAAAFVLDARGLRALCVHASADRRRLTAECSRWPPTACPPPSEQLANRIDPVVRRTDGAALGAGQIGVELDAQAVHHGRGDGPRGNRAIEWVGADLVGR